MDDPLDHSSYKMAASGLSTGLRMLLYWTLGPHPSTTWHIPIAWLVPTGNVGYTPLDNLHFIRMIVLGAVAGFTTLAYVGVSS